MGSDFRLSLKPMTQKLLKYFEDPDVKPMSPRSKLFRTTPKSRLQPRHRQPKKEQGGGIFGPSSRINWGRFSTGVMGAY